MENEDHLPIIKLTLSLRNLKVTKEDIQKALELAQETGNQFLESQIQQTLSRL